MDAWIELPQKDGKNVAMSGSVRPLLLAFFEKQLWQDTNLRRSTCWLYPSASMIDRRASVYYGVGPSFLVNPEQMKRRLSACGPSASFVTFVIKCATRPDEVGGGSWYFVIVDRQRRAVEMMWVDGERLPATSVRRRGRGLMSRADLGPFVALNVLPLIGLEPPSVPRPEYLALYKITALDDLCSRPQTKPIDGLKAVNPDGRRRVAENKMARDNGAFKAGGVDAAKKMPIDGAKAISPAENKMARDNGAFKAGGADAAKKMDRVVAKEDGARARENGDDGCALLEGAFLYLKLLNPSRSNDELLKHIMDQCLPGRELCTYLANFQRSIVQTLVVPPFRNVPLAHGIDVARVTKYSQSSLSMLLYLQYIAYRLEKETRGRLVCMQAADPVAGDAAQQFQVLEPALLKQHPALANRAEPALIDHIDRCRDRFFFASLGIRELRAEARRLEQQGGWSPLELVSVGHQNALIFDNERGILYRYEPHGAAETPDEEAKAQWVDAFVQTEILGRLRRRRYTYRAGLEQCPYIPGAQRLQANLPRGGFCVTWATMAQALVLLNPQWSMDEILARMANAGLERTDLGVRDRGRLLLQYIVKFNAAIDCVIPDGMDRLPLGRRLAVVRRLRAAGILPPLVCTQAPQLEYLDKLVYFVSGDANVFLGARTSCGRWITRGGGVLLNMNNQLGANISATLAQPAFQRVQPGSNEYNRWIAAGRRTGSGATAANPIVVDPATDDQALLAGIEALADFASQPSLPARPPSCPSL